MVTDIPLNDFQSDALREVISIGVGRGADSLNRLLQAQIKLEIPHLRLVSSNKLSSELKHLGAETISSIDLKFTGDLSGQSFLIFPEKSAGKLVNAMVGNTLRLKKWMP